MRTSRTSILAIWTGIACIGISSCKKDDTQTQPVDTEHEGVTTLIVTLTDTLNSANIVRATYRDADANGPAAPSSDTLQLTAGTTYRDEIFLVNQTSTPPETLSHHIEEEPLTHALFYTPLHTASGRVTITRTDRDPNNLPVGLEYTVSVSTGAAVTGAMRIEMYHYALGTKTANPSSDRSFSVDIPMRIQ